MHTLARRAVQEGLVVAALIIALSVQVTLREAFLSTKTRLNSRHALNVLFQVKMGKLGKLKLAMTN